MIKSCLLVFYMITFLSKEGFAQQGNFFQIYSSNLEVGFEDAIATSDGGYAMCGSDHGFNGGDFLIIKTDSLGQNLWVFRNNDFDGLDFDNIALKLVETKDSSIIIAGQIENSNLSTSIIYAKFNTIGGLVWKKQLPYNFSIGLATLNYESDSEIIITGNSGSMKYLTKINSNGDTLLTKTITDTSIYHFSYLNKVLKAQNEYYLFGSAPSSTPNFNKFKILKTDSVGNFIWSKAIYDSASVNTFIDIISLGDTLFLSLNLYQNSANSFFLKSKIIDIQGNLLLTKTSNLIATCGKLIGDSSFAIPNENTVTDTLSANIDNFYTNNLKLYRGYYSQYIQPVSVIYDNKNGIVFSGYIDDGVNTNSLGFLMRISTTENVGISLLRFLRQVRIFPNPAREFVTLQIQKDLFETAREYGIRFFDSEGKLVFENDKITNSEFKINTEKLKGIYAYQIIIKGNILSGKLIIN